MAVFGATQDIAIDAYRRELLDTDGELGLAVPFRAELSVRTFCAEISRHIFTRAIQCGGNVLRYRNVYGCDNVIDVFDL